MRADIDKEGRPVRWGRARAFGYAGAGGGLVAAAVWIVSTAPGPKLPLVTDTISRLAFWPLVWIVAARIGGRLGGSRLRGLAHLVWDGLCGMPVLVVAWLVVGLFPGGFQAVVLLTVLATAGVAAVLLGRGSVRGGGSTDGSGWILAGVAALGLVWNRVPTFFFDTLAYHFAQPELWLLEGRIAPETWSLHSWFPPGASVLYGVGLSIGGESWAADANLLGGLVALGLVAELARRLWGETAAPLAAGVALGLPLVVYSIAIPGADLWNGVFALAAMAALVLRELDPEGSWARRGALFCAGAVLTKYLAILVPLGVGALWLSWRVPGRRLSSIATWVFPSALLFAPWMLANGLTLANPLAPLLAGWIPTEGLAEGGMEAFRVDARAGLPGLSDVTVLGSRLIAGDPAGLYPSPAWGWVVIALAPLLAWAALRDRRVRIALALAAGWATLWFVTARWERFLVGVTLLLAVAAAGAVVLAWRRGGPVRLAAVGVLAVVFYSGLTAVAGVMRFNGGATVITGAESARAFTERVYPTTRLLRLAGERLDPETDRILFVGEMRHFRLPIPRAAPTGFNTHPLSRLIGQDGPSSRIPLELAELGYTHLLLDAAWVTRSAARYPSLRPLTEHPAAFRAFVQELGAPLAVEDQVALFAIPGARP